MSFYKISDSEFKKTIIKYNNKIRKLIELFEINHLQIALVIDQSKKLKGIVTDGDLRRGILKGYNLETPIEKIINKKYLVTRENLSNFEELMKDNKINHLPILSKSNYPIGLIVSESLFKYKTKENFFLILAGGKGKRLLPRTKNLPKPLLKIAGKPIIQHIIERSKFYGFKNYYISTNYLANTIEKKLGNGKKFNLNFKYIKENKELGTAGPLFLIKKQVNKPLILNNGDVLSNINYDDLLNFHKKNNSDITVTVLQKKVQNPYGVIKSKNKKIINIEEKPIYEFNILAGIYVINPEIIKSYISYKFLDMTDLLDKLLKIKKIKIRSYKITKNWIDVGNEKDYIYANSSYEDET